MKRDVTLECTYDSTPDEVWKALTDPVALSEWLMPVEGFAPLVGQRFLFRTKPMPGWDGTVACEVLEVDRPRRLAYTWKGGGNAIPATTVTWILEPTRDGTLVRLEHTGFTTLPGVLLSFVMGRGWVDILRRRLKNMVEPTAARVSPPEAPAPSES
jgi:uncharacterized protein YndB with AHSA1/START domain